MLTVFTLILVVPVILFFAKPILRKFNIPKATVSRAKLVHKDVWGGPKSTGFTSGLGIKNYYSVTFSYMIRDEWTDREFSVSKKIYDSFAAGDEGMLKHNYTGFVSFEKFKKVIN